MRIRLVAGLALLLASVPPAPQEAPAAERAGICEAYCELVNLICQAGAAPAGNEEPCVHLYRGCRDGCQVDA